MSRPKMSEAHRAQMRAKILDRANAILIEKGPEYISSRAIAKHLDLTHMGLFSYFPNQAAILKALAEREQAKICDRMQPLMKRARNEEIARVMEEALRSYQDFAKENPNLIRLIWIAPEGENPSTRMQPTIDLMAELIQRGMDQGVFHSDSSQTAALLSIGMTNLPFILAASGNMTVSKDIGCMSRDALAAVMLYLRNGVETHLPARKYYPGWIIQIGRWVNRILKNHT